MDVRIPGPPIFTPELRRLNDPTLPALTPPPFMPTAKEQAIHDVREAAIEERREEKANDLSALVKRIEALEATSVAIKALEETILVEKVVTLLKVNPTDTVVFTVAEHINIDDIPLSVGERLKETLGVAHVFFATHGVEISVIAPKHEAPWCSPLNPCSPEKCSFEGNLCCSCSCHLKD